MGKIKEELVTFGKAELTASCASVVDFGLAFFLSDIIGIYYGLANALGVISGGITNCILNYRYVFGDSKSKKKSVAWPIAEERAIPHLAALQGNPQQL